MHIQVIDHAMDDGEEQHRYSQRCGSLERFLGRGVAGDELVHDEGCGVEHR